MFAIFAVDDGQVVMVLVDNRCGKQARQQGGFEGADARFGRPVRGRSREKKSDSINRKRRKVMTMISAIEGAPVGVVGWRFRGRRPSWPAAEEET